MNRNIAIPINVALAVLLLIELSRDL